MALVKCPECGKENISDSAETCPSCGYAIKDHFEKIEQEKAFMVQKRQKQENLQREMEKKLKKIDDMPHPYKPSLSNILLQRGNWIASFFGFIAAFVLLCAVLNLFTGGIIESIICLLIGGFCGALAYSSGQDIKRSYENAMNKYQNWDRHKEKLKNDTINRYETLINDLKNQKFVA